MHNKFSPEVLGEWIDGIPYHVRADVELVDDGVSQFADVGHARVGRRHFLTGRKYKGIQFLEDNYAYEQTLPRETLLSDLDKVCNRNREKFKKAV